MKKILVIYPSSSHPSHNGSRSILLEYTKYLTEQNYDVHFLCINQNISDDEFKLMKDYWGAKLYVHKPLFYKHQKRIFKYFRRLFQRTNDYKIDDWYPIGLNKKVSHLQDKFKFDIIWVNYIWLSKVFEVVSNCKKVLYVHDVFTNRFERTGVDWFSVTKEEEKKALDRSDFIAVLQDEEAKFLSQLTKKKVVSVFGKFEIKPSNVVQNKNILFFASENNHNTEAIKWFIDNVFKRLIEFDHNINLIIGGGVCKALNEYKTTVSLLGKIDNIDAFYSLGNITINPVFHGTGLKIKTFESLAYGKLLVTHPHNIIGVPFQDQLPVHCAENVDDYCRIITHFLSNDMLLNKNLNSTIEYMTLFNKLFEERFNAILTV